MEKPIRERVTAIEVTLAEHVHICEQMHERNFRLLIVVVGGMVMLAVKQFGVF